MRKGSRIKFVILAVVLVLAAVLGTGYYVASTYTVNTVYVEGNVHYTEDEIKNIVMEGPFGNNSLYLSMKYKNKGVEGIPFVDVMDVTILAPDTVRITVYEKVLTGYVKHLGSYLYFDKDGYVVESSSVKTAGVPQITGLSFDHVAVGEALPVDNPEVFSRILNITKLLEKYKLNAENIFFHKSGDITVYFGNVKVALGSDSATLEDKLMMLPGLLPNLEGMSGTLQMQTYVESGGRYTFQPD
ncbi:MAG: FtsQ-type POTRA domain-containing protein [Acetatifactor sp.]|nr:FtsQ-type POTRA domain-containing protein [Acetatifactor sp.]